MTGLSQRVRGDTDSFSLEVFEYGPVVVFRWEHAPGWPVRFVSPNVGRLFGYADRAFLSGELSYENLVHPHDLARVAAEVDEQMARGVIHFSHAPYRILRADGSIRWVEDYTTVVRDRYGRVVEFIGYLIDATERLQAERELAEVRDRYDHILRATREGVWDWDLRTDEVYYSARWKGMLGHGEAEVGCSLDEWERRVHPDDLDRCYADVKAHLEGRTPVYENVHRMRHRDGSYLWILDRGIKILDSDGRPYRMIGTHQDITEERNLRDSLEQKTRELEAANERLQRLAVTDPMTGLWNRRRYYEDLATSLARHRRYATPFSLAMLDLDHFKAINDGHGHAAGDRVLFEFAELLRSEIRVNDCAYRTGGEEFCLILAETRLEAAAPLLQRLAERLRESPVSYEDAEIRVSFSAGLVECGPDDDRDGLQARADRLLYSAKQAGRDRIALDQASVA